MSPEHDSNNVRSLHNRGLHIRQFWHSGLCSFICGVWARGRSLLMGINGRNRWNWNGKLTSAKHLPALVLSAPQYFQAFGLFFPQLCGVSHGKVVFLVKLFEHAPVRA